MTGNLTILCVTRGEPRMLPFLRHQAALAETLRAQYVVVVDTHGKRLTEVPAIKVGHPEVHFVCSRGYIESVLDEALVFARAHYVFRIDDDETCSPSLARWLAGHGYLAGDHWSFPRAWLFKGSERVQQLVSDRFWPDPQTRLSVRAKSGGRHHVHCGSPYGTGIFMPLPLIHHALLVKGRNEREELVRHYDSLAPGSGVPCHDLYVPEAKNQVTEPWTGDVTAKALA